MNKFLIAVWGNPEKWNEVEYVYENESKKAKSTLPLIKDVDNPDKIIIVCSDTLSDNYIHAFKNPSYKDLKSASENSIRNFCKVNFGFEPDKVIVGYGFGEFDNTKFSGNASDFYYGIFKELVFAFIEYLNFENETIEVIFDITHGLNFTPVLTYKALVEILGILAYVFEVKFKTLNSDPLVGRGKVQKLNINTIEEAKIVPGLVAYKTSKRPIEPFSGLNDVDENELKNLGAEIDNLLKQNNYERSKIYIFLSSFIFGMPVYVLTYLPDHNNLKAQIDCLHGKFEEHISIKCNQKIEVCRKLKFHIGFENLVKAHLVSFILSKKGFEGSTEIPLRAIKDLRDKIYEKFPIESNRIDKEISDIEKYQYELSENFKTYAQIRAKKTHELSENSKTYEEIRDKKISGDIEKRNFFAHAGFEYNSIEIRKNNDKIEIKINENSRETVEGLLKDALKNA
jgi:CRISPR-associated protein Csx1